MNKPIVAHDFFVDHGDTLMLIARATRVVPPLWPLETAIAVNPLSGFEHLPYKKAVEEACTLFRARGSLPLSCWRSLLHHERVDARILRDVAIEHLGGFEQAFTLLGPDLSRLDVLMAALMDVARLSPPSRPDPLARGAALIAKWCGAFFAPSSGRLMRGRDLGLYCAVRPLLAVDREFARLATSASPEHLCKSASDLAVDAVTANLAELGIAPEARGALLERLVAALPGWAGHIRWRNEHADPALVDDAPATMADLLALFTLVLRAAPQLAQPVASSSAPPNPELALHFGLDRQLSRLHAAGKAYFTEIATMSEADLGLLFMKAAERSFRKQLIAELSPKGACPVVKPTAQLVFCIDVRSEPFRRAIEALGQYETFGYAGFFGVPMAVRGETEVTWRKQLPVLLQPQFHLVERSVEGLESETGAALRRGRMAKLAQRTMRTLKDGIATSFSTAEALGPVAAATMAARTFAPASFATWASRLCGSDLGVSVLPSTEGVLDHHDELAIAATFFRLTGLRQTAPLVLFVGHSGSAANNPYAAALDCGACGGHPGGANARVLAAILNKPAIREALRNQGMEIAPDTIFAAAEHDTTLDTVRVFDVHLIPPSHRAQLGRLMDDIAEAGTRCRQERARRLGTTARDVRDRATHWGEVRPEWGLAGNAAFIVGPRRLTRDADLEGRAFLHSYEWEHDPDGSALETILTAPMLVAQWINCQYLFSTIDAERFGAGDKITHNVLGGIGVVQGNGGDLRVGLPKQSLFDDDGLPFHVPQRLLTIVEAPLERIEQIIDRHEVLGHLFGNEWVELVALDPVTGIARKWRCRQEAEAQLHEQDVAASATNVPRLGASPRTDLQQASN